MYDSSKDLGLNLLFLEIENNRVAAIEKYYKYVANNRGKPVSDRLLKAEDQANACIRELTRRLCITARD